MRYILCLILLMLVVLAGCSRNAAREAGEYQTVARDLRRDTDRARQYNAEAVQLIEDGRFERAERALKRALAADITYGPAHNNLGKIYYHQNKLYLAAWEFQYAIQLMPNHPEPRNNLGLVFESVGRLNDAVEWYDKALSLEPDNTQVMGNLARARVRRGEADEQLRLLLSDLVIRDTRPEWVEWARQRLSAMPAEEQ
jgi:Flp pilus assembly protein TadD